MRRAPGRFGDSGIWGLGFRVQGTGVVWGSQNLVVGFRTRGALTFMDLSFAFEV